MQQFLSKTMPVSVSRKFLEEYNNNNSNNNNNDDDDDYQEQNLSSSYSSLRSISSFDPSDHSLHRKPTFSYIPIHKRRRSIFSLSRSLSLTSISNQHSSSLTSTTSTTSTTSNLSSSFESEMPTTPTSLFSTSSDQSTEYTSFPNLEKFADECWTEIRVEKSDNISDIDMESYDEMLVGGVRFQYS